MKMSSCFVSLNNNPYSGGHGDLGDLVIWPDKLLAISPTGDEKSDIKGIQTFDE
jgi:hypothetical protein